MHRQSAPAGCGAFLVCTFYTKFNIFELLANSGEFWKFVSEDFLPPRLPSSERLPGVFKSVLVTLALAVSSTTLAAVLAFFVSLFGSEKISPFPKAAKFVRGFATFLRNIPTLVWAFILFSSLGIGTGVGFIALCITSFAFMIRAFVETIEDVSQDCVESLEAVGAGFPQRVAQAIVPSCMNGFLSWYLYCMEVNIRASTIVGMVGGGGVGMTLYSYRLPEMGKTFAELARLDFSDMSLILSSLAETISIAVLSLLYSLILGIFFGMLAAKNVFRIPALSVILQSFFTFLRAVPTTVWVLLMLVCLGMGPKAGIAGLCIHTTAFFTKSFAQSFEDIPDETLEALEAIGASRVQIFMGAVFPSALSQIVAWTGMRFEVNFSECAILGMVGAGGIGYVISNSLNGYHYGTAGTAILLVFAVAYVIERIFVRVKKKFY